MMETYIRIYCGRVEKQVMKMNCTSHKLPVATSYCRRASSMYTIYRMRSLACILVRPLFVLPVAFLLLTSGFARERGPRVEVVCPAPPIPVPIEKSKVLVYELHVTNFDTVPLTLEHIEIFANNEESKGPLITLE